MSIDVLHDHYKESFSLISKREGVRGKYYNIIIVLLGLLFVIIKYPIDVLSVVSSLEIETLKNKIKLDISYVPISIILSSMWMFLLSVIVVYCQNSVYIEKSYKYLHGLEEVISSEFGLGQKVYNREGFSYFDKYPLFLKWVGVYYRFVFPVIVLILSLILLLLENRSFLSIFYNLKYDALIVFFLSLTLVLYRGPKLLELFRGMFIHKPKDVLFVNNRSQIYKQRMGSIKS